MNEDWKFYIISGIVAMSVSFMAHWALHRFDEIEERYKPEPVHVLKPPETMDRLEYEPEQDRNGPPQI